MLRVHPASSKKAMYLFNLSKTVSQCFLIDGMLSVTGVQMTDNPISKSFVFIGLMTAIILYVVSHDFLNYTLVKLYFDMPLN